MFLIGGRAGRGRSGLAVNVICPGFLPLPFSYPGVPARWPRRALARLLCISKSAWLGIPMSFITPMPAALCAGHPSTVTQGEPHARCPTLCAIRERGGLPT